MPRTITLKLERKQGQIHDFTAIVDGKVRISGDGAQPRSWTGRIPAARVNVKIWTAGVPGSEYVLTVDLPGTVDDFAVKHTLSSTLQKVEFDR